MTKRKLIIISAILSAIVLALFVILIVLISGLHGDEIESEKYDVVSIVRNLNEKNVSATAKKISVITNSEAMNHGKNSYLSVKSAIKKGFGGIVINVAFHKDGTPVLAENFDDVTGNSIKLEKVFSMIKSEDFKLVLNMGEVSDMTAVKKLIDKFDLKNKVIILADDEAKAAEVKRSLSNYMICTKPKIDGIDFTNIEELRTSLRAIRQNGASYILLRSDEITKEFAKACSSGHIGILAYGADTNASLQKVLSFAIDGIITDYPDDIANIISSLS